MPTYYTQRATPALAAQVRSIPGQDSQFATDFLGRIEDGSALTSVRLEAVENPQTRTWQINRLTRLGDGITRQDIEAQPGLCFFDALHYLARFQATELEMGKQVIPVAGTRWSDVPGYTQAARNTGQAIDADGEVHPCLYGHILTGNGFFSDEAYEIAAKTKTIQLLPDKESPIAIDLTKDLMKASSYDHQSTNALTIRMINRRKVINNFKAVIDAGEEVIDYMEKVVRNNFKGIRKYQQNFYKVETDYYVATTIFTLGLKPALAFARGDPVFAPVRAAYKFVNNFNAAVSAIEECTEKSAMQDFSKIAAFIIPMERAARIHATSKEQNKSARDIRKGLPLIARAGKIANLSAADIDRLEKDYLKGQIQPGTFIGKLKDAWESKKVTQDATGRNCFVNCGLKLEISDLIQRLENNT